MKKKFKDTFGFLSDDAGVTYAVRKPTRRANELDGKTWLQYSISVWNDIRKTPEEIRLRHPAMFPAQLPNRLMRMYMSAEDKIVLDPFMGTGSTLVACAQLGKIGYGFDIAQEYIDIANKRLKSQLDFLFLGAAEQQKLILDDARNLKKYLQKESVDMCITSPPYWDILSQKRTVDGKEIKDYVESESNLADIHNYRKFLTALKRIFVLVYEVLKPGKYCAVVVMDIRKKDKLYLYHLDVINFMQKIGFLLDDVIIWDRRSEYNNLRPIGYPSVFRVNKIHEFILIFQKPK